MTAADGNAQAWRARGAGKARISDAGCHVPGGVPYISGTVC